MYKTLACCRLQLFNQWSGWLEISKDRGTWSWSGASHIRLRKKSHSETWERNSKQSSWCHPQKPIPHAVPSSTPPHARETLSICVDTCTEHLPCWLESQEAQNLPALQVPIMKGTSAFLAAFTFQSAGYVHRIDSTAEVSEVYPTGSEFYK